ncbi:hypothetical protein V496_02606 [Pseudogymnoascus sp. VKM F-4515 (FW-2607)]|nr:hypothetical protein V496_02606 [Pseudogymnoascus sp. VKM F-4515 (FW-2607)]
MQYDFRLTVPRVGRALGWSSEIEGILFGSSSSDLEHLLIVPIQPASSYAATTSSAATVTAAAAVTADAAVIAAASAAAATAAADATTTTMTTTGKTLVTFCSLPQDIHWLIFDHLNDPADLTCLGLAFPYLWDITQKIVEKSRRVFAECIRRCQNPGQTSFIQEVRRKRGEIVTKSSPFIPRDQAWILWNLTRREFVTAVGIALEEKFIDGPFIKGIGFGEIVMLLVCWSSFFEPDLAYSRYVNRGVWAGDRFDITTRGQHDESTKDEKEWKDVSKEIVENIAKLWQYKYGNGWRKIARKIVAN